MCSRQCVQKLKTRRGKIKIIMEIISNKLVFHNLVTRIVKLDMVYMILNFRMRNARLNSSQLIKGKWV